MKKYVFLTCDDLTEFVVDDEIAFKEFEKQMGDSTYEVKSWSDQTVDWSKYDYAIIRTTWDYTKNLELFLSILKKIEDSGCELLNPHKIIQWNAHKKYLKDLEEKGVKIIPSIYFEDETRSTLKNRLKMVQAEKYVLKPTVGASADKIEVIASEDVLERFEGIDKPEDWFLQPFIQEVFNGEISYFYFGGEYSHAVKKVPKDGDFRVQEEHGGLISLHKPDESEEQIARNVLNSIDEKLLYARVDMLHTGEGYKLIELELIEPSLYFRIDPESASRYIKSLKSWTNHS